MEQNLSNFFMGYFWKDLLLLLKGSILLFSRVRVRVFSSCEFEFCFSTFGFGVGFECEY